MERYSGQHAASRGYKPKVTKGERICAQDGCKTVLSKYNDTAYCSVHNNPRRAKKDLLDGKDP